MTGEQSTEIPFESAQGEISDTEDQEESSSASSTTSNSSTFNQSSPTVVLSSPEVALSSPTVLIQNSTIASTTTTTSTSQEVTLPDGSKIRVSNRAKADNDVAELVQITSAARVNLTPKEHADVRHAITQKQHSLYKMDLASTNLMNWSDF
jgi:hypothetical protein